jgi:hypothetical protein
MDKHIYDKTDKGRDEIATRKYHVPAKLRSVLLMIDGHRPLEVLMKNFGPLGLSVDMVSELLKEEYIFLADAGTAGAVTEQDAAKGHGPSARARTVARREASGRSASHEDIVHAAASDQAAPALRAENTAAISAAAPTPAASSQSLKRAAVEDEMTTAQRHVAVHEFYTQTIKSTLGLRGMMLQLKVEKCAGLEDFRQLRDTYVDAVLKSKGREMALSLSVRLDQLLGFEHGERTLP